MKNILICGNIAGAGKDTVADYLVERYAYRKIFFAEPIYKIARKYFGMVQKDRKLLQDIGQKFREINPNVWVNYTYERVPILNQAGSPVVISDLRQMNELERGINEGFIPLRIVCGREIAIQRIIKRDGSCDITTLDGPAEDGTRDIQLPEIYNNNSFEDLYRQVDQFMRAINLIDD